MLESKKYLAIVLAIFIIVVIGLAYYMVQHNVYVNNYVYHTLYKFDTEIEMHLASAELALMRTTNVQKRDLNSASYKLACSYIKNRQYALALPVIEQLLETGGNGPYPITYDELIDRAHHACQWTQDEREFETFLLRMYSNGGVPSYGHKKIFSSLLEFYETHQRMGDAEQLCRQEIARGAVGRGNLCLAQVYADEGQVQEAEAVYKELLNRWPNNANTSTVLKDYRKLLLGMGKRSEANEITERLKKRSNYGICGESLW